MTIYTGNQPREEKQEQNFGHFEGCKVCEIWQGYRKKMEIVKNVKFCLKQETFHNQRANSKPGLILQLHSRDG